MISEHHLKFLQGVIIKRMNIVDGKIRLQKQKEVFKKNM